MLGKLLLGAAMTLGAANMLKKLVFVVLFAFGTSSMMRKLLLAAVVAIGATQADAGLFARPWYEGTFTCRVAGSSQSLEVYVTTQQGELAGWGRLSNWSGQRKIDTVQPRGDVVSFYINSNPRAHVELQRAKDGTVLTGKLVLRGKRYDLSCTRR